MGRLSMTGLTIAGSIFVLIGLIVFAVPVFTTQQTTELARIGDMKISTTETATHPVPPYLGAGALALGIVMIGAGLIRGR